MKHKIEYVVSSKVSKNLWLLKIYRFDDFLKDLKLAIHDKCDGYAKHKSFIFTYKMLFEFGIKLKTILIISYLKIVHNEQNYILVG